MIEFERNSIRKTLFYVPIWDINYIHHTDCKQNFLDEVREIMYRNPNDSKRSNLNGYQSANIVQNIIFDPLHRFIMQQLKYVLSDCEMSNCVAEIKRSWFNVNTKQSSNLLHTHTSTFSGVYYLKANKNSGKICFVNLAMLNSWNGYNLLDKRDNRSHYTFVSDTFYFNPIEGQILIWQSHIPHYVMPNDDDEDRISISFNIEVQKDIGESL